MAKGYNDSLSKEERSKFLEQISRQRWEDAENGTAAYQPPYNVLKGGEASEDGYVTISRAADSLTFPARFMLVAAMNPCPYGFAPRRQRTLPSHSMRIHQQWQRGLEISPQFLVQSFR